MVYREQNDMSSTDFQFAIQVFSAKRVCRRQYTHTLNQKTTTIHEKLAIKGVSQTENITSAPLFSTRHKVFLQKECIADKECSLPAKRLTVKEHLKSVYY